MNKILIGPRLRRLRLEHKQTQSEMAKALGVSTTYVNLLENNQRSLSIKVLMAVAEAYGVDWQDMIEDDGSHLLGDLRQAFQDPLFSGKRPDLQELRGAVDHAPAVVESFLRLYRSHRASVETLTRLGDERMPDNLLATSPETIIYDFFRSHQNHFDTLERAAEGLRAEQPCDVDDIYTRLKSRLADKHGIKVGVSTVGDLRGRLRVYEKENAVIRLSEALDHPNRVFQLAHVLCLVEFRHLLEDLTADSGIRSEVGVTRCHVELANYFAAAFLMPYERFLRAADDMRHDVDRLAATFGVSFEQVCHRLTTMQREGAKGVPFFFLRVDRAGNITKRFNSTSVTIADHGGSCPIWKIHASFSTPGVIIPQFVELPDGARFFTINRSTERPSYDYTTQNRRMAVSLGCSIDHAHRIAYASQFNIADETMFGRIGINCHVCPRQSCSQRAHQPLHLELPIDPSRRGNTRYES